MSIEQLPINYSGQWPELFKVEALAIEKICADSIIRIEHIGSTSVAGLMAKPIIDILIEVRAGCLADMVLPLEQLKFISKGEYGISGRAYFSRRSESHLLAVHLHCFEEKHFEIKKHLAFRDYLRAHRNTAKKYLELKENILLVSNINREKYQNLKQDFVNKISIEALDWLQTRQAPKPLVKKVVLYLFRKNEPEAEILVFDHVHFMHVSPQVVSGTVEKNEDILTAAHRELKEESGLTLSTKLKFLGSYVYYKSHTDQFQERSIFAITDAALANEWVHSVTGSGDDKDLLFRYHWIPISEALKHLQADLGDGLHYFSEEIKNLIS